jgi:hypothetical protein
MTISTTSNVFAHHTDGSNFLHFPERQCIQPVELGKIISFELLHKLKRDKVIYDESNIEGDGHTFSRRPISSFIPILLGVLVSTLPSAS